MILDLTHEQSGEELKIIIEFELVIYNEILSAYENSANPNLSVFPYLALLKLAQLYDDQSIKTRFSGSEINQTVNNSIILILSLFFPSNLLNESPEEFVSIDRARIQNIFEYEI